MSKGKGVWIFRRDLRLEGHPGLEECFLENIGLLPVFIFDPRQVESHPYRSPFGLQFLVSALIRLDDLLRKKGSRLHVFYGKQEEVFSQILSTSNYETVHASRDFTPFSKKRDQLCDEVCEKFGVTYRLHDALLLHEPEAVRKDDGTPYTVFTPFYKRALRVPWEGVQKKGNKNVWLGEETFPSLEKVINQHSNLPKMSALKMPSNVMRKRPNSVDYVSMRDIPCLDGTTGFSTHLKFGTLSPQLLRDSLEEEEGIEHPILRQLFWRDFFHHVGHHFPRVFGKPFKASTENVVWPGKEDDFQAWCQGKTGFPLIDAGMRELVQTGKMHNRVRMVVASFLTKDLEVDWRKGEKFFAQHLEDYDPCINNGNWQWSASTGCDAQPYFRIFNPWLQQKRFDPDGMYIKKWIPELKDVHPLALHQGYKKPMSPFYSPPLVDHGEAAIRSKSRFADVKSR
jgi:deoxyribodipyrimidine photo-lyase